jgi:hypothetical protein
MTRLCASGTGTPATGIDVATVRRTARRMADDGQFDSDGHGRYVTVTTVTAVTLPGRRPDGAVTRPSTMSLEDDDQDHSLGAPPRGCGWTAAGDWAGR